VKPQRRLPARARAAPRPLRSPARPQLSRLFWAVARLRSDRRLTATDLARQFEVDVRTACRDMDLLRDDWRMPIEFDRDRGSGGGGAEAGSLRRAVAAELAAAQRPYWR
jgi:predicted DNA-binding transcriptional regulator YafY